MRTLARHLPAPVGTSSLPQSGTCAPLARTRSSSGRSARAVLAVAAVAASVVAVGCLSPTLPLPPPEAPEAISQTSTGVWTVTGDCSPGAFVTIVVEREGVGAVVEDRDANGRYVVDVRAERCDVVSIWQTDGEETSAKQRVVLQEVENGRPVDSEECAR